MTLFYRCDNCDTVTFRLMRVAIYFYILTEVAGEGGPDLAPQKFLSSQKFRHLMG